MPQSREALKFPHELRATLSVLMLGATFVDESVHEHCLPLLFVLRGHAVVAFAVGNQNNYDELYAGFKKYYLKRASEWSAKDVSFVYCVPSEISFLDSFRSSIEIDVYFCRKYVLHLEENLDSCLARLPFLPLSPISPGAKTRPPSAQTLLQQSNMKAELASALVVPAKRSASAILEACLMGTYGDPSKTVESPSVSFLEAQPEVRVQTTLKTISIENFRAYRTKKEFSFGSAVTVLYGPNGFGKTSFFDAVDFVVTGGVGRLTKISSDLTKAARHLDSYQEPTIVSLTFERDGQQHVIVRDLADHNNALVDGKVTPRKEVLSLLTGGESAGADRVENMVSLFRATHLFSQDSQELTRSVEEKCELPADIVSRMLAFEDYVSGLRKAEDVLKLAGQMLSDANLQVLRARMDIDDDQKELERLEGLAAENTSPGALDERIVELKEVISKAGFNIAGIDPRDTRSLRGILESSATEAVRIRTMASKTLEQVRSLKATNAQLLQMAAQIEELQAQLDKASIAASTTAAALVTLTGALAEEQAKEKTAQNTRDWLMWAISVQPEYIRLSAQVQSSTNELSLLSQRLEQQRKVQAQGWSTHQDSAATVNRLEAELKAVGELRTQVQTAIDLAGLWTQGEQRLATVQALRSDLHSSIHTRRNHLNEAQFAVLTQELHLTRIEEEFTAATSNDSILKGLIANLRTHIDSASCLLCGHDHGSQDKLLAAIDRRMEQSNLVARLSTTLIDERTVLQALVAKRQSASEQLSQELQHLEHAEIEFAQLDQQRTTYESALGAIGFSLTKNTYQQLLQLSNQVQQAEEQGTNALSEARNQLSTAYTILSSAVDGCESLEREMKASSTVVGSLKSRLSELTIEANRGMINLETEPKVLSDAKQVAEATILQCNLSVQSASTALEEQKGVNTAANTTLATTRASHQQVNQTFNASQINAQSLIASMTAAGYRSDVSEDHLNQQIQEATELEVTALSLSDRVAELEVAVNIAATSAAFQNLRERIVINEKLVEQAEGRAEKVKPWIAYFERITKLLGGEQALATKHFITQYGPRTAVIQQRLRPVYGFGEIEVSSKDSTISIRVNRKGESLKPTHYFSQSQIQTLVLGLFLTACSSQTWSGFSSIMMDDPVTHFDDLNTYALLDLILGLQSSPDGARQFVISTCDEKLLQLARQKFKHMGSKARFYRFTAIGAEGPMVSEIPV